MGLGNYYVIILSDMFVIHSPTSNFSTFSFFKQCGDHGKMKVQNLYGWIGAGNN